MEENEFDLKMRSALEDGHEEVPAGVWSAIEGRLPAAAPARKAAVIWWKWAAAGVSAAAVAAVAVALNLHRDAPAVDILESDGAMTAMVESTEAGAATVSAEKTFTPEKTVSTRKVPAAAEEATEPADAEEPAETSYVGEPAVKEPAAEESTQEESAPETVRDNAPVASYETDEFDEDGIDASERTGNAAADSGISLGIFGDASSNTNPTSTGTDLTPMRTPTVPVATSIEETGESHYGIPVAAGLGIRIPVAKRWSVSTGLGWSMLTRTFAGQYNEVDGNGAITSQSSYPDIRNTQNYIGIPVDVSYSIVRRDFIDFYVYAGGSVNKCLTNRYSMNGPDGRIVHRSEDTGWQYSVGAGLGVEFIVAKRLGIYIDPSVDYWMSDGKVRNIRTQQPFMVGLEAGLRFRL